MRLVYASASLEELADSFFGSELIMQPQTLSETVRHHRENLQDRAELGFDLPRTHRYVKEELEKLGYAPKTIAKSGLFAVKRGRRKEAVAFRADMDALPATRVTPCEANAHMCGHDGHMAILLGLAEYLAEEPTEKSVVFLFQPAEETNGGAKAIVDTGLFAQEDIRAIFGLHLYPGLEEGKIGLTDGVMTAQDGEFDIVIDGAPAHGAAPQEGSDALLGALSLAERLNTIVKTATDPREAAVLHISRLEAGNGRNIVPARAHISGTLRTFTPSVHNRLLEAIEKACRGIEALHDVSVSETFRILHPPVRNDSDLFAIMKTVLAEEEHSEMEPMLMAEDFSHYQNATPGLFFLLGTKNVRRGFTHPLHSDLFDYSGEVLLKGIEVYVRIMHIMGVFTAQ